MQKVPVLEGTAGHVSGVRFPLEYGKTVVVGRSRSADLSLQQLDSYQAMSEEEREKDRAFRTVSGKHFEITMYNLKAIEVVNLSPNGTYVDGKLIDRMLVDDLASKSHEIAFGLAERMKLVMSEVPDPGEEAAGQPGD
ncbi:MAG TPA: FHA domain-containing protein [Planctomycetes bacterium]|nr:FHA domain-containing protein [Planctomycetota bacterium]